MQQSHVLLKRLESLSNIHRFWEGHKILQNLYCRLDRYYIRQIYGGDFAKICGLLRIYELYLMLRYLLYKENETGESWMFNYVIWNWGSFYCSSCIIVHGFYYTNIISNVGSIQIVDYCHNYADINKALFLESRLYCSG